MIMHVNQPSFGNKNGSDFILDLLLCTIYVNLLDFSLKTRGFNVSHQRKGLKRRDVVPSDVSACKGYSLI